MVVASQIGKLADESAQSAVNTRNMIMTVTRGRERNKYGTKNSRDTGRSSTGSRTDRRR